MTHTPGPWRLGPIHTDGSFAIHAEKSSVVHCKPFSSSFKDATANARLIAAAPEMLKVLQHCALALETAKAPELLKIANAAIALATGEK